MIMTSPAHNSHNPSVGALVAGSKYGIYMQVPRCAHVCTRTIIIKCAPLDRPNAISPSRCGLDFTGPMTNHQPTF